MLLNGLTVLVRPVTDIPKVSMQLWYHVGSKDEKSGEKGLAHLIEHMIFKGTDTLSESDMNIVSHKLSAYMNAFTSYDYTAYVFDFPTQNWQEGFFLLSDCMRNCRFDEQMLNSELKAVIQELKMYKDDYIDTLIHKMFAGIFYDHPYKYPIIGFKQDLWSVDRQTLFNFYQRHYVPNNATLVVVGDVTPEEVFAQAEHYFASLKADPTYKKEEFYHGQDLVATSVTVRRDVQQPEVLKGLVLPGLKTGNKYAVDVLAWLLGGGKSSLLSKILVEEKQLVDSFQTFAYQLEDATVFFFYYQPKNIEDTDAIDEIITQEIEKLKKSIPKKELIKAIKQTKIGLLTLLEKTHKQATEIATSYLMTGDENYLFTCLNYPEKQVEQEISDLLHTYFHASMMHDGKVVSLADGDGQIWQALQVLSDQEDARILDGRVRESEVEDIEYAKTVTAKDPKEFYFHKPQEYTLSNGVTVFAFDNKNLPKIDILLSLKARSFDEPADKAGIYTFVSALLFEGTKNYPGQTFAQELEQYGISMGAQSGLISMSLLKEDLSKALLFLRDVLEHATLDAADIEKVRARLLSDLRSYWDEPSEFIGHIVRQTIYKGHPYSKNSRGSLESLAGLKRADLVDFYKKTFSPDGARIAIVGDCSGYDVRAELEKALGSWKGDKIEKSIMTPLAPIKSAVINHAINRDQVVVAFAGLSVDRLHPDHDKLLLFDQVFCSGSMSTRLFALREQTGLFYTIGGSLIAGADEEPGMVFVKTIVSLDKLQEAKDAISNTINTVIDTITEDELYDAKQSIINSQTENFSSNGRMANAFLGIDRFKLGHDYFDKRARVINAITLDEVKAAARKILHTDKMIIVQVGRV